MKFTTVMKRFRRGSFLAVCSTASFVAIGTAAPIGITYVQVVTSSFSGVLHNQYDSINGLNQQLTNGVASGTPTASVTPTNARVSLTSTSFDANNNRTSSASSSAYSNLALGTVGVSASGSLSANTQLCCSLAAGQAALQDTMFFNNTTGHTVNIDVFWSFDGLLTSNSLSRNDFGSFFCFEASPNCQVTGGIGGGGIVQPISNARFNYQYSTFNGGLTLTTPTQGWVSSSFTSTPLTANGQTIPTGSTNVLVTFHGVYALLAGQTSENVYGNLTVFCGGGVIAPQGCDFGHTGALSFNLNDPGVSFTSASGVLLTGGSTAPEPAEWTMMLGGLGLLTLAKFRRR